MYLPLQLLLASLRYWLTQQGPANLYSKSIEVYARLVKVVDILNISYSKSNLKIIHKI